MSKLSEAEDWGDQISSLTIEELKEFNSNMESDDWEKAYGSRVPKILVGDLGYSELYDDIEALDGLPLEEVYNKLGVYWDPTNTELKKAIGHLNKNGY